MADPVATQPPPKWLGPLIMAGSVLIARYGAPSPGVPHWIAYTACLTFFLGGLAVMAIAYDRPGLNNYLGPAIMVCLAIIPTWIGFGPGERHCSGGMSFFGLSLHLSFLPSDFGCRAAFGAGAILIWLLLVFVAVQAVRGKQDPTHANQKEVR